MGVVYTAQDTGKMTEARALYEEVAARAASGYMQPTHMAITACAAGAVDDALRYAWQAYGTRDPMVVVGKY
jgi:hypothetical protein